MKYYGYILHDKVSDSLQPPFWARNDQEAFRFLTTLPRDNMVKLSPHDYQLIRIFEFDNDASLMFPSDCDLVKTYPSFLLYPVDAILNRMEATDDGKAVDG